MEPPILIDVIVVFATIGLTISMLMVFPKKFVLLERKGGPTVLVKGEYNGVHPIKHLGDSLK